MQTPRDGDVFRIQMPHSTLWSSACEYAAHGWAQRQFSNLWVTAQGAWFWSKKKKKKIQPVTAPWLFCFSSPSQILKIPNFLLNPFLIETLRVFSISCIESQPTQLLHIICWYGKNISCLSRLHTKSFCVVILFPFMFLISDGLWGPSKCLGLTYIPLFTLRVTKSAPAFFKTSANTFSQP